MQKTPYQHEPVMAKEVISFLNLSPGKTFVDCTLGGGGHSLNVKCQMSPPEADAPSAQNIKLIGFDQDQEALATAKEKLADYSDVEYINDNFRNLKKRLNQPVDAFLFDLGVSSYQLDEPSRGFSYQNEGPLDMRMDDRQKLSAKEIVNNYPTETLAELFKEFGEERFARRIALAIIKKREDAPIQTTGELKEVIENSIPTWKKRESVARVFQALRIAVNSELASLKIALADAVNLLNPGGRIVVLSYHSLEDRIVKRAFRAFAKDGILKIVTKKPVSPSEKEQQENPRSRSAKLRASEKI